MQRRLGRALVAGATVVAAIAAVPAGPAAAATATLQRLAPGNATYPALPVSGSATGDVTAASSFVDVTIPPSATPNTSTSGCEAADFAGFPAGHIAVLQRGFCTFAVKAANAVAAGAVAVVFFNEGQPGRTETIAASLGGSVPVPVVFTSFDVASELLGIGPGVTLRVAVTADVSACASPPAPGTQVDGKNVIVAQPGTVTVGTAGPDVIYGTAGPDRISAFGGDDLVFGFGGDDLISGGEGEDVLCGGGGKDTIDGGGGKDTIDGGEGDDDLSGGAGDDTMFGGDGTNRLVGGDGADTCSPGSATSQASCETIVGGV